MFGLAVANKHSSICLTFRSDSIGLEEPCHHTWTFKKTPPTGTSNSRQPMATSSFYLVSQVLQVLMLSERWQLRFHSIFCPDKLIPCVFHSHDIFSSTGLDMTILICSYEVKEKTNKQTQKKSLNNIILMLLLICFSPPAFYTAHPAFRRNTVQCLNVFTCQSFSPIHW